MFSDELIMYFMGQNMIPIKLNIEDLEVLYNVELEHINVLMVYKHKANHAIYEDKHQNIRRQIVEMLSEKHKLMVNTMTVICTDFPEEVSDLLDESIQSDERWIIDVKNNNVICNRERHIFNVDTYRQIEEVVKAESYRRAYVIKDTSVFVKEPSKSDIRIQRNVGRGKLASRGILRDYILTATMAIIVINIIVFFDLERVGSTYSAQFMFDYGAMHWKNVIEDGEVWRIFTAMFMHFGIDHLIGNMFVLFLLGNALEQAIGKVRFLIIYLGTGFAGGFVSALHYWAIESNVVSAGASGAIYGVMGAMIAVFIVCKIRTSISLRGLIIYSVISIVNSMNSKEVDHSAHMGGFTSGIILAIILLIVLASNKNQERGSGRI